MYFNMKDGGKAAAAAAEEEEGEFIRLEALPNIELRLLKAREREDDPLCLEVGVEIRWMDY